MWSVLIYDNSTINNGNGVYNYLFILHKKDKIQRTSYGKTIETKEWYYDLSVGCVENNKISIVLLSSIKYYAASCVSSVPWNGY